MIIKRRRFKQASALDKRLAAEAKKLREKAALLGPCLERETLLRKARQHEAAADMTAWLGSQNLV